MVQILDVERVIVAFSNYSHEEMLDLIRSLKDLDIQIDLVPRFFEVIGTNVGIHSRRGPAADRAPGAAALALVDFHEADDGPLALARWPPRARSGVPRGRRPGSRSSPAGRSCSASRASAAAASPSRCSSSARCPRRRCAEARGAWPKRHRGTAHVQDPPGPAHHPRRAAVAALLARRAAAAHQRPARRHEPRRPAPAHPPERTRSPRAGAAAGSSCEPGLTGPWQVYGRSDSAVPGDGPARLPVRRRLVAGPSTWRSCSLRSLRCCPGGAPTEPRPDPREARFSP